MPRTIHVIGAGLSGLAAAIRLAEGSEKVIVHEATGQAGGRCRSYHDHALGMTIDNGNHLLLSGNSAAVSFLRTIGTEDLLIGPRHAEFPFVDLATKERWKVRLGEGRIPWWIFDPGKRVPGTRARDYLSAAKLLWARPDQIVDEVITCAGPLYERLIRPLLLAALNTEPPEGSARLAAAVVKETLLAGGRACRPLIAREGLTSAFIDPAIRFLRSRGAAIRFDHQLRAITIADGRVRALDFGDDGTELTGGDAVILAVPFWIANSLLPDLRTPASFRAIVNAHFRASPPADAPAITGVINGMTEWVFAFSDRLSVTISNADRLLDVPREQLARTIWGEVSTVMGIAENLPPWQIVRERRATFAALPEEDARRPGPKTAWDRLYLAGDWTATGLPATIEGAIRSGYCAASLAMKGMSDRA